jgi:hypothetical protein
MTLLCGVVSFILLWISPGQAEPRYLILNIGQGHDWRQEVPTTINRLLMDDVINTLHTVQNPDLRIGVSLIFSTLNSSTGLIADGLSNGFRACMESNVPIMITLDGQNWWDDRPDLWNWWDPNAPGYNPANVYNVEWTGWSPALAVKLGWRNWGRQLRVRPAPNLASPKFLEANTSALEVLVFQIVAWYQALPPEKKHLFAGLKVGWEAGIGYNAYYYPDGNAFLERWPDNDANDPPNGLDAKAGLAGGLLQLGYAAAVTSGIKDHGVLTRDDLAVITRNYLTTLAKTAVDSGMSRDLIYTHQGGLCPPWELHSPAWVAMNAWSNPGWSFYWGVPEVVQGLNEEMRQQKITRWGAAEWWLPAQSAQEWAEHIEKTLQFKDCRFICIYNWNLGGVESRSEALEGIRLVMSRWKG